MQEFLQILLWLAILIVAELVKFKAAYVLFKLWKFLG